MSEKEVRATTAPGRGILEASGTEEAGDQTAQGIVACAVGHKGWIFLTDLDSRGVRVDRICTYEQRDDRSGAFDRIRSHATARRIALDIGRRPAFARGDLAFMVGWQFLLPPATNATTIVFHDSLLPRYRGFAPTVTALIKGEPQVGVTALFPTVEVDGGPILAQAAVAITYPAKIAAILERQALLMGQLAARLVAAWKEGSLNPVEQDPTQASYSLWRDEEDFVIDWSGDAREICRMIDATGYPYAGARTMLGNETIYVEEATALPDLKFEIRTPGKIWSLESHRPIVVCGSGLVRLERCRTADGVEFVFRRSRLRLGA